MSGSSSETSKSSKPMAGSREAKRLAAVILEVLSGVRGPQQGSEAMGISLNRYYQLERRALAGLIAGLEPRPKGKQQTPQRRIEQLETDKKRLERELLRQQSLLRAAQRSLGVPSARKASKLAGKPGAKQRKRRRRGAVRGLKLAQALAEPGVPASSVSEASS